MVTGNRQLKISDIIERFSQVLVFSPHMDDAVLSCGGLLAALSPHLECTTVTLCTADPKLSSNERPPHGIALPSERRHEEAAAMRALNCELVQLDFLDAIYRTDQSSHERIYPTLDSLWSMPVEADTHYRSLLAELLRPVLERAHAAQALILAPAGVGHHVDHILCTQTLLSLVPEVDSVLLYEDFPYIVDQGEHLGVSDSIEKALHRLHLTGVERMEHLCEINSKVSLILNYPSQLETIFGDRKNIRSVLAKSGFENSAVERFWRIERT